MIAKKQRYPSFLLTFDGSKNNIESKFDFKRGLLRGDNLTDLEKLFYVVSWKQGDIRKIKYVYDGLRATTDDAPSKGLTFWYFGKHLKDPINNPIVDRNVVLTFAIYGHTASIERIRKMSALSAKELPIVQAFVKWYRSQVYLGLRSDRESRETLNDILFCVGQRWRKQE